MFLASAIDASFVHSWSLAPAIQLECVLNMGAAFDLEQPFANGSNRP